MPMLGPTIVPLSRRAGPKGKGNFKKGEWQEQHQQAFEAAKAAVACANLKLLSYLITRYRSDCVQMHVI